MTYRCHTIGTFRTRIKRLISVYFCEESHEFFEKEKPRRDQAEKDRVPMGKDGQDFEDAVADEGSIELMLLLTPL
jgi:hypothetical protein